MKEVIKDNKLVVDNKSNKVLSEPAEDPTKTLISKLKLVNPKAVLVIITGMLCLSFNPTYSLIFLIIMITAFKGRGLI